jgi:hypothetical protein
MMAFVFDKLNVGDARLTILVDLISVHPLASLLGMPWWYTPLPYFLTLISTSTPSGKSSGN